MEINLGYKNIEDIKIGDYVLSENPETGEQEYNLVVDTYAHEKDTLVNLTIDGEEIITTENHPFWVINQGWTCAADIDHGGKVKLSDGKYGTIERVEIIHLDTPVTVYNFEVENMHTYFVGEQSVLVHNDCSNNAQRMTNKEVKKLAEELGMKKVNGYSKGELVFKKGSKYFTYDNTSHNGGVWKVADSIKNLGSKSTRIGTLDKLLNWIGE